MEVFGPTIQGEGDLAGEPTMFVRFGGCDYRCAWCDSMHAVEPALVREHAKRMDSMDVLLALTGLVRGGRPAWVTLSGGNPALLELGELVEVLQGEGFQVAVETQGSQWREWLANVDRLVVSPKPPSSGMVTPRHEHMTYRFIMRALAVAPDFACTLKIVVFDQADLIWAKRFLDQFELPWRTYLSCGTARPVPGEPLALTRDLLGDRYRWLCEAVAGDPDLNSRVRVLPQLHVLAWGHALGV
jgi:7-carboxy-7-deazaguanine synthase